jgi:hypothetical protein
MTGAPAGTIRTDVSARPDRLPWSRWHRLVLAGLGISPLSAARGQLLGRSGREA